MEAILGADDFDAETAERYGWINRALPDADLDAFVARLARRIASFPADAVLKRQTGAQRADPARRGRVIAACWAARERGAERGVLYAGVAGRGAVPRDRAVLLAALSRIVVPTPARCPPGSGPQAMMSSLPQFHSELLEPT
jgi:hypothetical protein